MSNSKYPAFGRYCANLNIYGTVGSILEKCEYIQVKLKCILFGFKSFHPLPPHPTPFIPLLKSMIQKYINELLNQFVQCVTDFHLMHCMTLIVDNTILAP